MAEVQKQILRIGTPGSGAAIMETGSVLFTSGTAAVTTTLHSLIGGSITQAEGTATNYFSINQNVAADGKIDASGGIVNLSANQAAATASAMYILVGF